MLQGQGRSGFMVSQASIVSQASPPQAARRAHTPDNSLAGVSPRPMSQPTWSYTNTKHTFPTSAPPESMHWPMYQQQTSMFRSEISLPLTQPFDSNPIHYVTHVADSFDPSWLCTPDPCRCCCFLHGSTHCSMMSSGSGLLTNFAEIHTHSGSSFNSSSSCA